MVKGKDDDVNTEEAKNFASTKDRVLASSAADREAFMQRIGTSLKGDGSGVDQTMDFYEGMPTPLLDMWMLQYPPWIFSHCSHSLSHSVETCTSVLL